MKVIGLAGNPNTGKTTVFNLLTGSNQYVGNWPGVTVEKKEGFFELNGEKIKVVDLPGVYSLYAYSIDEKIARNFIVNENPDCVVVIVDASNLERNLYLVLQILELGKKVVVALNMMDIAKERGIEIDHETLSKILGVKFVPMVASRGEGLEELKTAIKETMAGEAFSFRMDYGKLEPYIEKLEKCIPETSFPSRFVAVKVLEGDPEFMKKTESEEIESVIEEVKKEIDEPESYVTERRYAFIHGLVRECTRKKPGIEDKLNVSDMLDRVLTHPLLGIPLFLFFMWLAFQIIFKIGSPFADILDRAFGWFGEIVGNALSRMGAPYLLISLVKEGIIAGIGSVVVFVPNIFLLFLVFSFLEDSGYMARAAFVMDRLMHVVGLHGKSFIPMLLGFGCNVPAIMATRTLESEKDRILTILINPLMSCSARLPIYVLFASAFFPAHQGWVVFSLYFLGIVLAVLMGRLFKNVFFRGESPPLIMELPPYHIPTWRNVFMPAWTRTKLFLKKAGTVIFAGVVVIWLLASLPPGVEYGSEESLIGLLGKKLAPVLSPAGFGFWQAAVALIFGIVAKEVVVGTLGTLLGGEEMLREALKTHFTPLSAYAFMVMCLIYIPCIASIATIKQEAGWKWAIFSVVYSLVLGWVVAVLIYQIGKIF